MNAKKIYRDGLPPRYLVDGMKELVTDEVGVERLQELETKYAAQENTVGNRSRLRKEMHQLMINLKFEGRLFRRDGRPFL